MYLASYDACAAAFPADFGILIPALFGTIAELLSSLIWTPMEVIKARQQMTVISRESTAHSASLLQEDDATEVHTEFLERSDNSILAHAKFIYELPLLAEQAAYLAC